MSYLVILKGVIICFLISYVSCAFALSDGEGVYATCELKTLAKYSSYRKAVIEGRDTFEYFDVVYIYKGMEDSVRRGTVTQDELIRQITRSMQISDDRSLKINKIDSYNIWCDDSSSFLLIKYFDENITKYMRIEMQNNRIVQMLDQEADYARDFDFIEWANEN
jgi:hypothetical protein